jgi:hypothetical protein
MVAGTESRENTSKNDQVDQGLIKREIDAAKRVGLEMSRHPVMVRIQLHGSLSPRIRVADES